MSLQPASTPQQRAGQVLVRLAELFEIGRQAGTNRPGLGEGEQRAHDLVASWMAEAGLEVEVDRAGNLIGRLPGSDPSAGRGVDADRTWTRRPTAACSTARWAWWRDWMRPPRSAPGRLRRTIAVVAFRLEEGCRFGRGVFGSRAMVGDIEPDEGDLLDADGISVRRPSRSSDWAGCRPRAGADPPPACFVETHIEQGPALAAAGAPLGVVTSIAGMAGLRRRLLGQPRSRRHGADVAALGRTGRRRPVRAGGARGRPLDPRRVTTIGRLVALPGATNTIPGRVELFADLRAPDAAGLDALVERAIAAAAEAAAAGACTVEVRPRWRYEPVAMDPATAAAVRRAVAASAWIRSSCRRAPGTTPRSWPPPVIPSAMLFVRSDAGGVSHAPEESTGADAIAVCVQALESALRELAAMTDWEALARPSLQGLERYDPGPSRDQMKERYGLAELEPLNWNEDLFGPPRRGARGRGRRAGEGRLLPGAGLRRLPRRGGGAHGACPPRRSSPRTACSR